MTQVIVNLGTGGSDLNGRNGSTASADSNDALFLDWPGDNAGNYVYLPGSGNNVLSVPSEAALNISGAIDLRVLVALDDWTPSATSTLIGKWGASGDRQYLVRVLTDGRISVLYSADGTTTSVSQNSSASISANDGSPLWVRVTILPDNGSGNYEIEYFTSVDGDTYTQLGVTRTASTVALFAAGTSELMTGGFNTLASVSNPAAGKFYRAQVLDGIGGTTVLDVDTSVITSGSATSFTAVTGQTVTINRSTSGRKSVAVVSPVWLFGTDDFMEVPDNDLLDFDASDSFTVLAVKRVWGNQTGSKPTIAKAHSTLSTYPGYVLRHQTDSLQSALFLRDSTTSVARTGATITAGDVVVMAGIVDRAAQTARVNVNGTDSATTDISARGSFENSGVFRIAAFANSTTNASDMEFVAAAIFRRALTAQEVAAVTAYYQSRLS